MYDSLGVDLTTSTLCANTISLRKFPQSENYLNFEMKQNFLKIEIDFLETAILKAKKKKKRYAPLKF